MRVRNAVVKTGFLLGVLFIGQAAAAGPVRCSEGNQDSTCITPIVTAWQAAPTCSTGAGWTTTAPAKWIGSKYSAPTCNYQAPPSCPNGFNQTSAPSWNGSSWVGLGCVVPPPALPSLQELAATCEGAIGAMMARAGYNGSNGTYRGQWDALQGPWAVSASYPISPQFSNGGFVVAGPSGGAGDFYYANDLGNPPAGGATGSNGVGMCWFQSGTGNLIGYGYASDYGHDGG